ncbi:MAG: UDP-N-acetylmuramoyl-L-alanine--D-glutamate ligase [Deltaproteobacteria bacterium]|nr:UDP-N-acetylmuramoyl-L-alanine--D-glutamate ligase [Deltaproteobacteria bacterium]
MKLLHDPRGARVAVTGGGKTGAAVARTLLRLGARVEVHDDATADKVAAGLQKHGLDPALVTVVAGGLSAEVLSGADLIVLSPGVPRAHPALAAALPRVPCVNELELGYAQLARGPAGAAGVVVLAITGTNGKSTTTTMAGAIARARDPHAFVGGNLGTPLCAAIEDGLVAGTADAPRLLVVELSSYQLETIAHLPVDAGAVTNLTPDHLDRYPSVDAYYQAKARLFALVKERGGVTLNARDPETRRCLWSAVPGRAIPCHFDVSPGDHGVEITTGGLRIARAGDVPVTVELANPRIVGHHNRQNAAAAAALAVLTGLDAATVQSGLDSYAGIAHRLERVGTHNGVTWWNDSKATNVDAAVTALRSFAPVADGEGVHLIAGGLGKGAPYAPLVDASRGRVVAVYTIGADAPAIAAAYADIVDVVESGDLRRATAAAAQRARPGQHIVLSPACASFDQFRDYGHRGDEFRACFAAHAAGEVDDADDQRGHR